MTDIEPAPEVVLNMPARAEGVGVVRQALAGLADALAFDAAVLSDMKMAVTEACTNVVVHAYDDEPGLLEVAMVTGDDDLTIVVRDHGTGIAPKPARTEPPALGLGLPLIAALSDAFELRYGIDGGEPTPLREIGRQLGITPERVRQIESKALGRLGRMRELDALRQAA